MQVCRRCGERNPDRARFCMMCGDPLESTRLTSEVRKVVTVLFADLKGSTSIGERLDPEAIRSVYTRFYDAARETIEARGGTVEKFIGDAVMAVFGVPTAHEDDARRGVEAAAALQDRLGRMNEELLIAKYGVGLELRIGVNTGEVVAGDPSVGSSFVAGDAVNVGARLEQAAQPGGVLLGEETYRQAAWIVDARRVEPIPLKGKSEPVPAYALVRIRDEAEAPPPPTFVDRAMESRTLDGELQKSEGSRTPHRVVLSGQPGIGKSRLADVTADRWRVERGILGVSIRSSADGEADALGSISGLVRQVVGVDRGASLAELERTIVTNLAPSERAETVAQTAARALAEGGSSDERMWVLVEVLNAALNERPVAIFVKDAHRAASSILEVLDTLIARCDGPLIEVLTAVPEDADDLLVEGRSKALSIPALDQDSSRQLVDGLLDAGVPSDARDRIVGVGAGNPLFLIESARLLSTGDRTGGASIPTSIRGVIDARLDQLRPGERGLLGAAAVIGGPFHLDDLDAIAEEPPDEGWPGAVRRCVARGLLEVLNEEGPTFTFAHPMVRDVAYAGLTKAHGASLHEAYADHLEHGSNDPALLAGHLERALQLRLSVGLPGDEEHALASRTVTALARSGERALDTHRRVTAVDAVDRATAVADLLAAEEPPVAAEASRSIRHVAFRLGDWSSTLGWAVGPDPDPIEAYEVGVALTQVHRKDPDSIDLAHGRALLESVLERSSGGLAADAAATLAGTWKDIDDERAAELYRQALKMEPGDPYALGNLVEYEIQSVPSSVGSFRDDMVAAAARCGHQIDGGMNMPWAAFDLAKFSLLLGQEDHAFLAACLAADRSTASFMLRTSLDSLAGLAAQPGVPEAISRLMAVYALTLGGVFRDEAALIEIRTEASAEEAFSDRVLILAGGSSAEVDASMGAYADILAAALDGSARTIVSGGTTQGVSAIAGKLGSLDGLRAIGYLPQVIPDDLVVDEDASRYARLRRTDGANFGVAEPIAYWSDLIASGVDPAEVRLLGIGGGRVSAVEYRLALALGAGVGAVRGSGGAAARLLQDPWWAASPRLAEVVPDANGFREFLQS